MSYGHCAMCNRSDIPTDAKGNAKPHGCALTTAQQAHDKAAGPGKKDVPNDNDADDMKPPGMRKGAESATNPFDGKK